MPQAMIEINGRTYTLQCGEGQEDHLRRLARMVDTEVARIREKVGQLGEIRLLIMAALVMADKMVEQEETLNRLRAELEKAHSEMGDPQVVEALLKAVESATERLGTVAARAKTGLAERK